MKKFFYILVILGIASSCNQNLKMAKEFAGETWEITQLKIDTTTQDPDHLSELVFEDCDMYDELCYGSWENHHGGKGRFIWQFREKGNTFQISNQSSPNTPDDEEAAAECSALSGIYKVSTRDVDAIVIECSTTIGYNGKKVTMRLEKHAH